MRAREPDEAGFVERDGVRVGYERFGDGDPAILFVPAWAITHSRLWKGQVPYLSRHTRVITLDPRGNGRSDRVTDPALLSDREVIGDIAQVLNETGTERAILVGISDGGWFASIAAAVHPDRVAGLVLIGTATPLGEGHEHRQNLPFDEEVSDDGGWRGRWNRHFWLRDYRGFLEWFGAQIINEPHSTKQIEDFVDWGLDTTPEMLLATLEAELWTGDEEDHALPAIGEDDEAFGWRSARMQARARAMYDRIGCPVLVMHGDSDVCDPYSGGLAVAAATGARFAAMAGCGHVPVARYPVKVNLLIREFLDELR